jgi:hypothetical protein
MDKKIKKFRKVFFPVGIFLMLFVIQSAAVIVTVSAYFIHTGKKRISDIETYTKNYCITMAEGFSGLAELSSKTKNYNNLRELFQEKLRENTVDEAFYVLADGKIIVHSNKNAEKNLEGNIANDEFLYNLDTIFMPVKKKSKEVLFENYNYIGKDVPFSRDDRMLLKKYLYDDIDKSGWVTVRAVFNKNKPVGTVGFIISKERIFGFIKTHIDETYRILYFALSGVFSISLFVSIFIFVRYRMIESRTLKFTGAEKEPQAVIPDISDNIELLEEKDEALEKNNARILDFKTLRVEEKMRPGEKESIISIELLAEIDDEPDFSNQPEKKTLSVIKDEPVSLKRQIKDPIPLTKKVS